MIYFIQQGEDGPIKIGFSEDSPENRLMSLQAGNPNELNLVLVIEGDIIVEKSLHEIFKDTRLRGEWFSFSHSLDSFIKEQKYKQKNKVEYKEYDAPMDRIKRENSVLKMIIQRLLILTKDTTTAEHELNMLCIEYEKELLKIKGRRGSGINKDP